MLRSLLLDLDNTLVLFDEPAFFRSYFPRIAAHFADLLDARDVQSRLIRATRGLAESDGRRSNAARFREAFAQGLEDRRQALWERFLGFYATEFARLPVATAAPEGLAATMARLQAAGLPLVVATNPIFPAAVQRTRLGWVGLADVPFSLVTDIDNCAYVKPHPEYYRRIAERLGVAPEACLMVGNDPLNDMAAGLVGMRTYLTDDAARRNCGSLALTRDGQRPAPPEIPQPDFQGPLAGVPEALRRLGVVLPEE